MPAKKVTILCEDKQHAAFMRRFFSGKNYRVVYENKSPNSGAGEQYVREQYPKELQAIRGKKNLLAVMIDADNNNIQDRIRQLDESCDNQKIARRGKDDRVVIFVPARNIETWIAFLDDKKVNETDSYPKLNRESECKEHVNKLLELCQKNQLPENIPCSLRRACKEWNSMPSSP